jgi:dCMP deaminase
MSNKEKEIKAYFKMAQAVAEMSYCNRLQVGTIIVKDNRVISYGYNGTVSGDENVCENEFGKTKDNVIHSEMNAIYKCAKSPESAENATMYITHSPCPNCSYGIVQSGIKHVYYQYDYRDLTPIEYLRSKGITVEKYNCEVPAT